jgi:nicotinate-nucleotide pyrophosphorylase (carboxylating)
MTTGTGVGPFDPPRAEVREAVARALSEDIGPLGDLTASLLPASALATGALVARQAGVLAGIGCAEETFHQVDPDILLTWDRHDGDRLKPGDRVGQVHGSLRSVVTSERTALNFLCHLSGIASATRQLVDVVLSVNEHTQVCDTRKTTPGLRALEKAAVRAGGAANHRGSLSDMVLVEDNHLAGLSVTEAVALARRRWPARTVEVECDGLEQVAEAVEAGATIVMCDNMTPDEVAAAVSLVAGRALVEASGGINLASAPAYAAAGANLLSTSTITQSAPALDIGLDLEPLAGAEHRSEQG